jgi:hypothetical protein
VTDAVELWRTLPLVSMNGEYLRVTPDELAWALKDPEWALELAEDVQDTEDEANLPPSEARYLSTHKAWQAIGFILERAGFPVDIVYGEGRFANDEDIDWGYGPPQYLTPERVRVASQALAASSFDALTAGVTPAVLAQADIYPQVWDEPDSLEWVRGWFEPLIPYFIDAARQRQALLIWLD